MISSTERPTPETDAEIARALQIICEAFGTSVHTQYKVAAIFVEGLAIKKCIRAEALEDAAMIADHLSTRAGTAEECADAIRAAKEGS